jgi:hypothetical protein
MRHIMIAIITTITIHTSINMITEKFVDMKKMHKIFNINYIVHLDLKEKRTHDSPPRLKDS